MRGGIRYATFNPLNFVRSLISEPLKWGLAAF
jgi:hypothetical protein